MYTPILYLCTPGEFEQGEAFVKTRTGEIRQFRLVSGDLNSLKRFRTAALSKGAVFFHFEGEAADWLDHIEAQADHSRTQPRPNAHYYGGFRIDGRSPARAQLRVV